MGRPRRAFTQEFKREAVKLATESGHPTAQVARDLGLTPNWLRRWKQEVAGDPIAALPGKGTAQPSRRGARPAHAGCGPCDEGAGLFKHRTLFEVFPISGEIRTVSCEDKCRSVSTVCLQKNWPPICVRLDETAVRPSYLYRSKMTWSVVER